MLSTSKQTYQYIAQNEGPLKNKVHNSYQFSRIPLTGPSVGHVPRFQLQRELHQRLVKTCTQSQLLQRFHSLVTCVFVSLLFLATNPHHLPQEIHTHKLIEEKHFKRRIWSSSHRLVGSLHQHWSREPLSFCSEISIYIKCYAEPPSWMIGRRPNIHGRMTSNK